MSRKGNIELVGVAGWVPGPLLVEDHVEHGVAHVRTSRKGDIILIAVGGNVIHGEHFGVRQPVAAVHYRGNERVDLRAG